MSDKLSLSEGVYQLTKRFNRLTTTMFVQENIKSIVWKYNEQNVFLSELKSYFRPLVPEQIMHNKIFSGITSLVYNAETGYAYNGINITDGPDLPFYYWILIKCGILEFFLNIILLIFSLYIVKFICNCFQNQNKQFEIMFFWICANYINSGSLEQTFAQSYIKILFFIPLLWVLGVIKISYRRKKRIKSKII